MELKHYGVKGQKWGVRRYQNYDGTRIKTGAPFRKTRVVKGSVKDSNAIYNTLSKDEKNMVMGENTFGTPPEKFIASKQEAKFLIDQVLVKYGDIPVAAFDMWNQGNGEVSVSIMTNKKYRNQGFADMAVKEGDKAFENNKDLNLMTWGVWAQNKGSRRLANDNGFKYSDWHDPGGEKYLIYKRHK